MSAKKLFLAAATLGIASFVFWYGFRRSVNTRVAPATMPVQSTATIAVTNAPTNMPPTIIQPPPKIKRRAAELTAEEKAEFLESFEKRYKPALIRWCKAFGGRVPFSAESVTADTFVERLGKNAFYRENIFVVDGITLGIQDARGLAHVDYLNDPRQTRKMESLPKGAEAPIIIAPVNREEIMTMLAAESGTHYLPNDVRMVPSGFSGGLNGGSLVQVGGNPENSASWHYDMAFGPDGKLAYYLNNIHK